MSKNIVTYEIKPGEVILRVSQKKLLGQQPLIFTKIPDRLQNSNGDMIGEACVFKLQELLNSGAASLSENELHITDTQLLTDRELSQLGVPPLDVIVSLTENGHIAQDDFAIALSYFRMNNQQFYPESRSGRFLFNANKQYIARLSSPIAELCNIVDSVSQATTRDDRLKCYAELNTSLNREESDAVTTSNYLRTIHIFHAESISLNNIQVTAEDITFDPILMQSNGGDDGKELLPSALHESFLGGNGGFNKVGARKSYVLESGKYIFADSSVKAALSTVQKLQKASANEKKNFVRNPTSYIRQELKAQGFEDLDELCAQLFIETDYYSDRVEGIGLWTPPVLPWIRKSGEKWIPDEDLKGIQVAGNYIALENDEIPSCLQEMQAVYEHEVKDSDTAATVTIKGIEVPVTAESIEALKKLHDAVIRPETVDSDLPENGNQKQKKDYHALIVKENLEDVAFIGKVIPRSKRNKHFPATMKNKPKTHQVEGLAWLQNAWLSGVSGCLLADDMGLGKTFQILSFLCWLREFDNRPILIVAPTALLKNWEEESIIHCGDENTIGEIVRLYGKELKELKTIQSRDTDHGAVSLDESKLKGRKWVVTSYETMRDYHISLGKIKFATIVYDEAQKIKNPRSTLSQAARSLNADMSIALTGTPVENRLADLHTIADTVRPGWLGSLKQFSIEYEKPLQQANDNELVSNTLQKLKAQIEEIDGSIPPFMMRRMKDQILDEATLKPKQKHMSIKPMPAAQADAYSNVLAVYKQASGKRTMLEALQQIRRISLHPYDYKDGDDIDVYFKQSARLQAVDEVLRDIADQEERVLIFCESRLMHLPLQLFIKKNYGGDSLPALITGEHTAVQRQNTVAEFQKKDGFNCLILSPKAAGVGLTITNANHVIHLTRWWNPAVEDQATDRAHRIGQKKTVNVYYPIAEHPEFQEKSFDKQLQQLVEKKRSLSQELLMPIDDSDNNKHSVEDLFHNICGGDDSIDEIRYDPDEIATYSGKAFERWIASNLERNGFTVRTTNDSHDKGLDVYAETDDAVFLIQCKHQKDYKKPYNSVKIVEDLRRASLHYPSDKPSHLIGITNAISYADIVERASSTESPSIRLLAADSLANLKSVMLKG